MKAAYIKRPGPTDALLYGNFSDPEPGDQEVLVRVGASAVNPVDTYIRSGMISLPIPLPYIPGLDFAGTVEAVGPGVKGRKPGDRVWGTNRGLMGRQGTCAEYVVANEGEIYRSPQGVPDDDLAALACVGITAHLGLFQHAQLKPDETLFVTGGSGGVGSSVVQMAKIRGARVITTARTKAKADICRKFGADEVIRYKEQNVAEAVRKLVPGGIHVWFETTRQPNFELTVPLLCQGGRMVIMAGRDAAPAFPVGPFYVKDCRLLGYALFNTSAAIQARCARDINQWVGQGRLRAHICKTMPLSDAAQAHRIQEQNTIQGMGTLSGKIILKP